MGLPQLRWWDNHSWTEFTSAARTPLIVQDEPRLAYADDDFPSRRSQREQRTSSGAAQQAPMSKAELMSTLRELEPPKPQQIERNQPAPSFSADDEAREAERLHEEQQAAAQQRAAEQHAAQQRAAQQQAFHAQQQAQQRFQQAEQPPTFQAPPPQGFPQQAPSFQQPQSFQAAPEADPFAEFLSPTEEPRPARSSVNYADGPSFPQPQDAAPAGYADPAAQRAYARSTHRRLDRSQVIYTPAVWALAMIPMLQMVVILLSVSSGVQSVPIAVPIAIQVIPYLGAVALAYFDRRSLLAGGHSAPAHWALAFLTTPVYLIARSVATNREFGKGITPILVWVSLGILQLLSVIAVPGILISTVPEVFKAEVEQSIAQDAAIVGTTLNVECPNPAVQIGVQFTCLGTTETGNTVEINVSLQRSNGWIDWRVDSQIWQSGALN